MTLTIGSLFSGIGGLELGLELVGLGPVVWQVEIDPWCRDVLAAHWPGARRYDDVRAVGKQVLERVDVVCGGFPCQDVSHAGRREGLDGARSGLWFEFERVVGELRPRGVVVENVGGLVRRGLDEVVQGLLGLGYAVEGSRIQAADVGAPHRRERVLLVAVAHADGQGRLRQADDDVARAPRTRGRGPGDRGQGGLGDADVPGLEDAQPHERAGAVVTPTRRAAPGRAGAAQPGLGRGADGLPSRLDLLAQLTGRPGWPAARGEPQRPWEPPRTRDGVPDRARRLKALGNAVVPQCAALAGLRLHQLLEDVP